MAQSCPVPQRYKRQQEEDWRKKKNIPVSRKTRKQFVKKT